MAADLVGLAVSAEGATEKLATGLAQAGVDEQAVKAVEQCAEILRKVVAALGKGQAETGDAEPAAPATTDEATDQMMDERAAAAGPPR